MGFFSLSVKSCQLINQRALPRPGRPSHADYASFAGVRKKRLQQVGPTPRMVFDGGDGASKRARITRTDRRQPFLIEIHT